MAKLLRCFQEFDPETGSVVGLVVRYRAPGGDRRGFLLENADVEGLTPAEIRALAQARADADTAGTVDTTGAREDILPNPTREARQWFRDNSAIRAFFEQDPAGIESDIDGATTAQLKAIIKGCAIIARTYGLLEIADI